jgi:hypothetical protein
MKKIIVILLAGFMLTGFRFPVKNNPVVLEVTELTGYKLRSRIIDYHDFNLWVVTNEDVFTRDFEPIHDSVLKPRFDEQMVLAAKVETVHYSYRVKFRKTMALKGVLNVYFSVSKEGPVQETELPVSMIAIPKDKAIKKVQFYHDNMLVKTVPIVAVY